MPESEIKGKRDKTKTAHPASNERIRKEMRTRPLRDLQTLVKDAEVDKDAKSQPPQKKGTK